MSEKNREFNINWEDRYFFVNNNGKPQCLVSLQVIPVLKEFNVQRHYKTLHEKKYCQYRGTSRKAILKDLKRNYFKQTGMLKSFAKCDSVAHLSASYDVALTLAKKMKAFRDGEVVKECAIKMALAFGAKEFAGKFQKVSLSHQIVAKRVKDLSDNAKLQLQTTVMSKIASTFHWP